MTIQSIWRAVTGLLSGIEPTGAGHQMLAGLYPGFAGSAPLGGTRERVGAYANTPWLHAVADKVASAFAAVEWQLYAVRRPGERARRIRAIQRAARLQRSVLLQRAAQQSELVPIQDHPLLDILEGANGYQTGVAFRKTWALQFDLSGDAFLLKERDGLGDVVALWPVPASWIMATPTPSTRFYRVAFRGWHGSIPDEEFLWVNRPDPLNPYGRGVGLVQPLADEIETDEMAAKHMRQVFLNSARPDYAVFPKSGSWTEAEAMRVEQSWRNEHQGFWRVARPKFISQEVGIHEFGEAKFREMQMAQIRGFERDAVFTVWGVPPELMAVLQSSNRATVTAAQRLFARWVLVPRLEFFRAAMQEKLIPEFDDRLIIDYVDPVEGDPDLELQAATVAPWAASLDEWRAKQGLPPMPDGAGSVHMVPLASVLQDLSGGGDLTRLSTQELIEYRRLVGKALGR